MGKKKRGLPKSGVSVGHPEYNCKKNTDPDQKKVHSNEEVLLLISFLVGAGEGRKVSELEHQVNGSGEEDHIHYDEENRVENSFVKLSGIPGFQIANESCRAYYLSNHNCSHEKVNSISPLVCHSSNFENNCRNVGDNETVSHETKHVCEISEVVKSWKDLNSKQEKKNE